LPTAAAICPPWLVARVGNPLCSLQEPTFGQSRVVERPEKATRGVGRARELSACSRESHLAIYHGFEVCPMLRAAMAGTFARFIFVVASLLSSACASGDAPASAVSAVRPLKLESGRAFVTALARSDTNGNVFVADPRDGRVAHFSSRGELVWSYDARGDSTGRLRVPVSVMSLKNRYWIADASNGLFAVDPASGTIVCNVTDLPQVIGDALPVDDSTIAVAGPRWSSTVQADWITFVDTPSCAVRRRAVGITIGRNRRNVTAFSRAQLSLFRASLTLSIGAIDTLYVLSDPSSAQVSRVKLDMPLSFASVGGMASRPPSDNALARIVRLGGHAQVSDSTAIVQLVAGRERTLTARWFMVDLRNGQATTEVESVGLLLSGDNGAGVALRSVVDPTTLLSVRFK